MKYEYGKEYETNGEKPDLPDDVLVSWINDAHQTGKAKIGRIVWDNGLHKIKEFRIVDERYKPKPNDWHKRGELPPVGEVVECNDADGWQKRKILAVDSSVQLVVELFGDKKVECNHPNEVWTFRPIRSERDKLVEKAKEICKSWDDSCGKSIPELLVDAGWRPIKKQSESEFVQQCVDICEHGSTLLYRAGCRFVERGERK